MYSKKCHFNPLWVENPLFSPWVEEVSKDDTKAYFKLCKKCIDIASMRVSAQKSRMKSKLHNRISQSRQNPSAIRNFFGKKQDEKADEAAANVTSSASVASTSTAPQRSEVAAVVSDAALHAVVLWALKLVMSHYSFSSSSDVGMLFPRMFPDNQIAKTFLCGATKCAYLVCFGLSTYFHDLLVEKVRSAECYTISFDECMNPVSQNEQMDFIVRYWDNDSGQVSVRYFESQFLGHARASDLLNNFKEGTQQLEPKRLLQVSMGGPNVNWKFFSDLQQESKTQDLPELLNIGSCGFHTVHRSLQKGANVTGWKIGNLLRSLWQLFHDTPAKREDFTTIRGSKLYPLQFCQHRWVEDAKVAERALQMWPNVEKFVASFKGPRKAPSTASFASVKAACEDPLSVAKLQFFISVA